MKTLLIVRGLPGAGKTTFVEDICMAMAEPDYAIHSFEQYMPDPGREYPSSDFREWAREMKQAILRDMHDEVPLIILHDVYAQSWQWADYLGYANTNEYRTHFIIVENHHQGKSVHEGISDERMEKYRREFKVYL